MSSKIAPTLMYYFEEALDGILSWGMIGAATAAETIARVKSEEFSKAIENLKKKIPRVTIIYRKGSGTNKNLTPRPADVDGLSYQLVVPFELPFSFTAMELVNKTGVLCAINDHGNHVCVRPTVMSTMASWINSRDNAENAPHEYTVLLRSISVRVG